MIALPRILLCFVAAVALQAILCRLPSKKNALHNFLLPGVPLGALILWLSVSSSGVSHGLAHGLIYAFLCEIYMFLIALLPQSVSLRLLSTLRRADASLEDIDRSLSGEMMVAQRLQGLVREGFLRKEPGRFALSGKGRRLASLFDKARRFFGHAGSPEWAARSSNLEA